MRSAVAALVMVAACGGPPAPVAVGNTSTVVVPQAIAGKVIDGKTREPLPGATIVVQVTMNNEVPLTTVSDERGAFRIDDVPPGPRDVVVYYTDITNEQHVVVPSVPALAMVFALDLEAHQDVRIPISQPPMP